MAVSWSEFENQAPDLAHAVKARFAAHPHHILGTLRNSGAPRLNGTEVYIEDELRIGVMSNSRKLSDLRRDGRAEVHTAPLEDDLKQGDARVGGVFVEERPTDEADGFYFKFLVDKVVLTQVADDELVITSWTPQGGTKVTRRK